MPSPSFYDLINKQLPPIHSYIQPGLLPVGGKLLLAGQEKIGKSFIVMQMMKDLTTGGHLFGCPYFPIPVPAKTLYFEQELGEHELQKRALAFFGNAPQTIQQQLIYQSKNVSMDLSSDSGINLIHQTINSDNPNVVIFDPLRQFHLYDENDSQKMACVMQRLNWLSQNNAKHSTIIIHHENKPQFDPVTHKNVRREGSAAIRGSTALTADVDSIIMVDLIDTQFSNARMWRLTFKLRQMPDPGPIDVRWDYNTMDIQWVPPLPGKQSGGGNAASPPPQLAK